jgi:hypothetical protein
VSPIAHDAAHLTHHAQLFRGLEVMQREADPRDIHGLGPIAQGLNKIAAVQRDGTGERLKSLARQLQCRLGEVDPVIRGDLVRCIEGSLDYRCGDPGHDSDVHRAGRAYRDLIPSVNQFFQSVFSDRIH